MGYIGNAPGQKDISAYTNIGAQPAGSDELLLSDAGVLKAVTVDNLIAGAGGGNLEEQIRGNHGFKIQKNRVNKFTKKLYHDDYRTGNSWSWALGSNVLFNRSQ